MTEGGGEHVIHPRQKMGVQEGCLVRGTLDQPGTMCLIRVATPACIAVSAVLVRRAKSATDGQPRTQISTLLTTHVYSSCPPSLF